jgi:hypothetical protein
MRDGLPLIGRKRNMVSRARRRWLVVGVYVGFAVMIAGLWFCDHWKVSSIWIISNTWFVNFLVLGGKNSDTGLVKNFSDRWRRRAKIGSPAPDPELLNDERELSQRDRAHYLAYWAMMEALTAVFFLSYFWVGVHRLLDLIPISTETLLHGLLLSGIVVGLTLPQAILLWTEPDMEEPQ